MIVDNASFFSQVGHFLSSGREVQLRVAGDSMLPFLADGDCVCLAPVESVTIKRGDVLLAMWQGRYVLHRVVRMERRQLVLTGDHNLTQLETVSTDRVLGVMTVAYRAERVLFRRSAMMRWLGLAWYVIRPGRRVWTKARSLMR